MRALTVPTAVFGCLCGLAPAVAADTASAARPIAVVELFTSQSCANCPPADALLGELAREADLVALSYPVDYWDYLGWKDTAAKPEFTQRQKGYANRRGDHDVFTPQVVVNGRTRVVGSDLEAIRREITTGDRERHDLLVEVTVESGPDGLRVRLPDAKAGEGANATVWLVRYENARTVSIGKGENNGRIVTYSHLVRALQPIGMWRGKAATIELPRPEAAGDGNFGCAVLVQLDKEGLPGPILGAKTCGGPRI
jgi:hypothetical protein